MRRALFAFALAALTLFAEALPPTTVRADEAPAWAALKAGAIVLFRHANAPGTGDPPNMTLGDCATQRNLDAGGRAQAVRIG